MTAPVQSNSQGPLLAIETSGGSVGVALLSASGETLFTRDLREGMLHGKALAPLVTEALASATISAKDLGAIAVSAGPGSWTGLRIGISMAKAMAWALKIPLVAVPSFDAMALNAVELYPPDTPPVTVLLLRDARSEGAFASVFRIENGFARRLTDDDVVPYPALPGFVSAAFPESGNPGVVEVLGDPACLNRLVVPVDSNWNLRVGSEHIPALAVARAARAQLIENRGISRTAAEIHALGPVYLRASDPEIKRLKALQG